jgi:hypothetical protein
MPGRAVRAGAEDLDHVVDVHEPVLLAHRPGPALDGRVVEFDGAPARPAGQVVMVPGRRAAPVDRLPLAGAQDVDLAVLRQVLQSPVDGGQPDAVPAVAQAGMDLLGADEFRRLAERHRHGVPLPGLAARGGPLLRRRGGGHADRPSV